MTGLAVLMTIRYRTHTMRFAVTLYRPHTPRGMHVGNTCYRLRFGQVVTA